MKFKKPSFDFSNRGLTEFPKEIFDARRVYKLNLSNNNIKEIPKEIERLKYLETLDLSGNIIRNLYANLFELPNLKILNLNNNHIITIPKQIVKLQRLKILLLSNNKLTELPPELIKIESLEELNISNNMLDSLPINAYKFPLLKTIWLAHNPLRQLSSEQLVKGMPKLKAVYFHSPKLNNPLATTDRGIKEGAAIKGNCIKQIKTDYVLEDKLHSAAENIMKYLQQPSVSGINDPIDSTIETGIQVPKIFISYSHDDKEFLKPLKKHLKVLNYEIGFDVWDDSRIKSSQKWKDEIEKALQECEAAILLVSTDFLASDFIRENELQPLLKRASEERGVTIHSVIVRPCRFSQTKSISQFQAVNSPDETLSEISEPAQERIWIKLCNDIQYFLEQRTMPSISTRTAGYS